MRRTSMSIQHQIKTIIGTINPIYVELNKRVISSIEQKSNEYGEDVPSQLSYLLYERHNRIGAIKLTEI